MPWFKVDDTLAFHAKVLAAGNPAMGLWVRAGSWCSQQLTDGFVPSHMVSSLGTKPQAKALVEAGLWVEDSDGFRFWQWSEQGRQPSRVEVEAEREAARERMRRVRERRRSGEQADSGSGEVRANTQRSSGDVRQPRPDPTRKELPDGSSTPSTKRGTRIPDDFTVTPEMVEWAQRETPGVDGRRETEKFVDHWRSKPGQAALKLDWVLTWRNWMRTAYERAPQSPSGQLALVHGARKSTTDQRVADGLALAQQYRERGE